MPQTRWSGVRKQEQSLVGGHGHQPPHRASRRQSLGTQQFRFSTERNPGSQAFAPTLFRQNNERGGSCLRKKALGQVILHVVVFCRGFREVSAPCRLFHRRMLMGCWRCRRRRVHHNSFSINRFRQKMHSDSHYPARKNAAACSDLGPQNLSPAVANCRLPLGWSRQIVAF